MSGLAESRFLAALGMTKGFFSSIEMLEGTVKGIS
jgi:hypothetical protein